MNGGFFKTIKTGLFKSVKISFCVYYLCQPFNTYWRAFFFVFTAVRVKSNYQTPKRCLTSLEPAPCERD